MNSSLERDLDQTTTLTNYFHANVHDRFWRLNNLYWIQDENGNKVKFKLNWAQQILLKYLWPFMLVLKARQLGVTTFWAVFFLDQCVFKPNQKAGIIAHTQNDAEEIFRTKVKYVWDNMACEWGVAVKKAIASIVTLKVEQGKKLVWSNDSSFIVSTSMRSGTASMLLISEFGKICAKFPDKAKEIVTGAMNAVHKGNLIVIESTAEGREGYFYDFSIKAENRVRQGSTLTPMDFQFFFFPWWKHPNYKMSPDGVTLTVEDKSYFEKIEAEIGVVLDPEQKAWYIKKRDIQKDDMKREFPSSPKEAFEASIEGAYYAAQMGKARDDGRIGDFPFDPRYPVMTMWDLGINDEMSIVFFQDIDGWINIIDFFWDSGQGFRYYKDMLDKRWQDFGYRYKAHYMPHDINVRNLDEDGRTRKSIAEELGIKPILLVPRHGLQDGIETTRVFLGKCRFDQTRASSVVDALDMYRKEWDVDRGCHVNVPRHDRNSHVADAVRQGAMGHPALMLFNNIPDVTPKAIDIPDHWPHWRSLSWGSFSKPFCIGWYAKGPTGKIIRYREYAGKSMTPVEVATKIKSIEADEEKRGISFNKNPAGKNIWNPLSHQKSVAKVFWEQGLRFLRANIDKATVNNAWEHCNQSLKDGMFENSSDCPVLKSEIDSIQMEYLHEYLDDGKCPAIAEWMLSLMSRQVYEEPKRKPTPKHPLAMEMIIDDSKD